MGLTVKLIAHTTRAERVVAAAAKLCYSASPVRELFDGLDDDGIGGFLAKLRDSGHVSPFEHAGFTFAVEGVSRVATHQLVRHRIASFSQRSQRYVAMKGAACVVPPEISQNDEAARVFAESLAASRAAYEKLSALGIPREDARFILPHGVETSVIVTMNARELLHFFGLRLCRGAQWEIRNVARAMLSLAAAEAPGLFADAGPSCVRGACAERRKSCGKPYKNTKEVLEDK
ncbi:MAG: FAD-dependent thymidylate synthase [Synergistaceae bacterium]|nr:FAD-dependent thymidylate synthase [Synergistaceae bacterium]